MLRTDTGVTWPGYGLKDTEFKSRQAQEITLLTPWSRVPLEKLASLQLVKKFPAFYGTWTFLTALTSARHLSLSWASPIQSSYPNPTSWRSILILSSHLPVSSMVPNSLLITQLSPLSETTPIHIFTAHLLGQPIIFVLETVNFLQYTFLYGLFCVFVLHTSAEYTQDICLLNTQVFFAS